MKATPFLKKKALALLLSSVFYAMFLTASSSQTYRIPVQGLSVQAASSAPAVNVRSVQYLAVGAGGNASSGTGYVSFDAGGAGGVARAGALSVVQGVA